MQLFDEYPIRKVMILGLMIPFCLTNSLTMGAVYFGFACAILATILIQELIRIKRQEARQAAVAAANLPAQPAPNPEQPHLPLHPVLQFSGPNAVARQGAPAAQVLPTPYPSHANISPRSSF